MASRTDRKSVKSLSIHFATFRRHGNLIDGTWMIARSLRTRKESQSNELKVPEDDKQDLGQHISSQERE